MMDMTEEDFQASILFTERLLADTECLIADCDSFIAGLDLDALHLEAKNFWLSL